MKDSVELNLMVSMIISYPSQGKIAPGIPKGVVLVVTGSRLSIRLSLVDCSLELHLHTLLQGLYIYGFLVVLWLWE